MQNVHFSDLARVVADTWQRLQPAERAPYEAAAAQEASRHAANKQAFADMQAQYQSLYVSATVTGAAPRGDPHRACSAEWCGAVWGPVQAHR